MMLEMMVSVTETINEGVGAIIETLKHCDNDTRSMRQSNCARQGAHQSLTTKLTGTVGTKAARSCSQTARIYATDRRDSRRLLTGCPQMRPLQPTKHDGKTRRQAPATDCPALPGRATRRHVRRTRSHQAHPPVWRKVGGLHPLRRSHVAVRTVVLACLVACVSCRLLLSTKSRRQRIH